MRRVDPAKLRHWLADGREIALLDVREGGAFSGGHLLLAANLPLSKMEVLAPAGIPRRATRIVLTDNGDGIAERAAALLAAHGYSDLHILEGGVPGWAGAGFAVFSGTNVPSKAFGEHVEHGCDTPSIDAATLHAWQTGHADMILIDARPFEEFRNLSLPGSVACPGAELVVRLPGLLRSPETKVVIHCAGRTRSIIGAQSLRDAGLPNPVYALRNGIMGWQLAGFDAEVGRVSAIPSPDEAGLGRARDMAQAVAARSGVVFLDAGKLAALQAEADRTTYLFDVRQPVEYLAGHRPGSRNVPGGQLVQATDLYAPVRGARIVLVDRHGVQAVMTAHWLMQMGWPEVFVLRDGLSGRLDIGEDRTTPLGLKALPDISLTPAALAQGMAGGQLVAVDVGESYHYRRERIPGSYHASRARLGAALERLPAGSQLVFVCGDDSLSRFAAADAARLGRPGAGFLEGGRAAWRAAGLAMEASQSEDDPLLLTGTDDMWYPPFARGNGAVQAMREYLSWEVDLLHQLVRESYLQFGPPRAPDHRSREETS